MHYRSIPQKAGKSLYTLIILSIIMLPVAPVSSLANETKGGEKVIVLSEQSKSESESPQAEQNIHKNVTKQEATETAPENVTEAEPTATAPSTEIPKVKTKQISTGTKVALGVGAGVVAIAGIAALSGGSGSSSPTPPTPEKIVGTWQANANSADGRTYNGVYTLYAGGSHTYDLYISDGRHKVGNGSWSLVDYNLTLRNYSGSTYNGTFAQGVKNTVTLGNTQGTWKLIITK